MSEMRVYRDQRGSFSIEVEAESGQKARAQVNSGCYSLSPVEHAEQARADCEKASVAPFPTAEAYRHVDGVAQLWVPLIAKCYGETEQEMLASLKPEDFRLNLGVVAEVVQATLESGNVGINRTEGNVVQADFGGESNATD